MIQYLQNNVIMKWNTRFIRFTDWIPLKYGSTTTPPIIAHCKKTPMSSLVFHIAIPKTSNIRHPEFWPSHKQIFKTRLYYKMPLILENWRYGPNLVIPAWTSGWCYRTDKLGDGRTDAGNDNTRRPILASGKNQSILNNHQNTRPCFCNSDQ